MAQIDSQFQFSNYWPQVKATLQEICEEMTVACLAQNASDESKVLAMHRKAQTAAEIYKFIVSRVEVGLDADPKGLDSSLPLSKQDIRSWVENQIRGA